MTQFEYLILDFQVPNFIGIAPSLALSHARYMNGVEIQNWKNGPPLFVQLNYYGFEGWEVISFTTTSPTAGTTVVVLKRPLPKASA